MLYMNGERVGSVFPIAGSATAVDLVFEYVYDEVNNPIATIQSVTTRLESYSQTVAAALEEKQNVLTFAHAYDAETNPVATLETVSVKVAEALAEFVADAPESLNELKELAAWILSHETDAATMNASIKSNKNAIENNAAYIQQAIAYLQNGKMKVKAADVAEKATNDGDGNKISDTYAQKGVGGVLDINASDWADGVCSKTISGLGDKDAIFFSPATVESKGYIEAADIFISASGSKVTFTCLFTTPNELVQFNYFIVKG